VARPRVCNIVEFKTTSIITYWEKSGSFFKRFRILKLSTNNLLTIFIIVANWSLNCARLLNLAQVFYNNFNIAKVLSSILQFPSESNIASSVYNFLMVSLGINMANLQDFKVLVPHRLFCLSRR
jgi:hypothetical protein